MAQGLGVKEVREAVRAQGDRWFTAEMIGDELDVDWGDMAGKRAIWKALQFLERKHELRKERGHKEVSRWKALTLRSFDPQPVRTSRALEFALLSWKPQR